MKKNVDKTKRKIGILAIGFLLLAGPLCARGTYLPSMVVKRLLRSSARLQQTGRKTPVREDFAAYLRAQGRGTFEDLDDMLQDYFLLDQRHVSSAALKRNRQELRRTVRNWLERDFYAAAYLEPLRKNMAIQALQGPLDYAQLIPRGTRLILLGEVHQHDWMVNEVERAVLQLQKTYPNKHVYYASEFVDAPAAGRLYVLQDARDVEHVVRKRPYYRPLTERLVAAGVRVVGLENPALSEEFVQMRSQQLVFRRTAFAWKTVSASALKERNQYWTRIIRQIYQQDPQALVVVHAGLGHTDYNHANSLPWMLKEFTPFVVEFSQPGMEDLNTLLKRHVPVDPQTRQKVQSWKEQNPLRPIYLVRQFKSKRAAVTVGCDLHVKRLRAAD